MIVNDTRTGGGLALGVGVSGEGTGPGDVAMAGGVQGIATFVENPTSTGMNFAESEIIGSYVLVSAGKALFRDGELVHKGETEAMLFTGEIDFEKTAGKLFSGFPTDLTAETGLVAGTLDGVDTPKKAEQGSLEKVPIFRAGSEKGAEPKLGAIDFVKVEGGEIALAHTAQVLDASLRNLGVSALV